MLKAWKEEENPMGVHGGDIYRNQVNIDFSVNVNPLGTPEDVKAAMRQAVEVCGRYPDMEAEELKQSVSSLLGVPKEYLLFGNGASELFMAIAHGIKPGKAVIPVPSFYGYEYAAKAAGCNVVYYGLKQEDHFCMTEDIYSVLTEGTDLLFLANPNNPTGTLHGGEKMGGLLQHCREQGITVVLDECFIEFSGGRFSMLSGIEDFDNLILVRAFTKVFAIPGVRLGYLVCKNDRILMRIASQLPEWNLSCFAQAAGCVCARQKEFLAETERLTAAERQFLEEGLRRIGFQVFPSRANFLLVYSKDPLYEKLLEQGILIRDCSNFRGLCRGFYRIAVKGRRENEILLNAMQGFKD